MGSNYQGVFNSSLTALNVEVTLMINRGWIPLGPPQFHPAKDDNHQNYVVYMWKPQPPAIVVDSGRSIN